VKLKNSLISQSACGILDPKKLNPLMEKSSVARQIKEKWDPYERAAILPKSNAPISSDLSPSAEPVEVVTPRETVRILGFQSVKEKLSSYILYRIGCRVTGRDSIVEHRYSAFEKLSRDLYLVQPHGFVLPEKRMWKSDDDSIQHRRNGLESFLSKIFANPNRVWRDSDHLKEFLGIPMEEQLVTQPILLPKTPQISSAQLLLDTQVYNGLVTFKLQGEYLESMKWIRLLDLSRNNEVVKSWNAINVQDGFFTSTFVCSQNLEVCRIQYEANTEVQTLSLHLIKSSDTYIRGNEQSWLKVQEGVASYARGIIPSFIYTNIEISNNTDYSCVKHKVWFFKRTGGYLMEEKWFENLLSGDSVMKRTVSNLITDGVTMLFQFFVEELGIYLTFTLTNPYRGDICWSVQFSREQHDLNQEYYEQSKKVYLRGASVQMDELFLDVGLRMDSEGVVDFKVSLVDPKRFEYIYFSTISYITRK
jgi:hypothetical protein